MTMPEPVKKTAKAPKSRAAKPKASVMDRLLDKYRLNVEVNLRARGKDGTVLGPGPILDPGVIEKFASLDTTEDKRYLDWMLFQAGGGEAAYNHSKGLWGDGSPEITPDELINKFNETRHDQSVQASELNLMAQNFRERNIDISPLLRNTDAVAKITRQPNLHDRYKDLLKLVKDLEIAPGKESRVTLDIIANKFKLWIKNQLQTKTRDRYHSTLVYLYLIRGQTREEAEAAWKEAEPRRRKEYIFGDQDSLKWESFGYNRYWPGRKDIYQIVYDTVAEFIKHTNTVLRQQDRINAYNAAIADRNKTLPPDQQLAPRPPIDVNLDIGKVIIVARGPSKGELKYEGDYPTVASLAAANRILAEMPISNRITSDVRYAGPKGVRSKDAKLYSDENLDVVVPLTVAASIKSGMQQWPISNPSQIPTAINRGGQAAWTGYAKGEHGHPEWTGIQAIPIMFHLKVPGLEPRLGRLLMMVFASDLTELQAPYVGTVWKTSQDSEKLSFSDMMRQLKNGIRLGADPETSPEGHGQDAQKAYLSLVRSMTRAMNAIKEWGKEFDPQDLIGDFVKHHRDSQSRKRTIGEDAKRRAAQIIDALLE